MQLCHFSGERKDDQETTQELVLCEREALTQVHQEGYPLRCGSNPQVKGNAQPQQEAQPTQEDELVEGCPLQLNDQSSQEVQLSDHEGS